MLALIADGLTNRQIGTQLSLAEKTVKNYVSGLLSKLGLQSRTQAAVLHLETRHPAAGAAPLRGRRVLTGQVEPTGHIVRRSGPKTL